MKKIITAIIIFLSCSLHASGVVTTFINSTDIDISLEIHFSDNTIVNKIVSIGQSYDVINFSDKKIVSILFNSNNKDKNGNLYQQTEQKFPTKIKKSTYIIGLRDVPAHIVPAAQGTDEFQMPLTHAITCTLKS